MRSLYVLLQHASEPEVAASLSSGLGASLQAGWRVGSDGHPILYVTLEPGLLRDLEPEQVAAVRAALGSDPRTIVAVDVSGRHPGGS